MLGCGTEEKELRDPKGDLDNPIKDKKQEFLTDDRFVTKDREIEKILCIP